MKSSSFTTCLFWCCLSYRHLHFRKYSRFRRDYIIASVLKLLHSHKKILKFSYKQNCKVKKKKKYKTSVIRHREHTREIYTHCHILIHHHLTHSARDLCLCNKGWPHRHQCHTVTSLPSSNQSMPAKHALKPHLNKRHK